MYGEGIVHPYGSHLRFVQRVLLSPTVSMAPILALTLMLTCSEMNDAMMSNMGADIDGNVSEDRFVTFFDEKLAQESDSP